MRWLLAALMLVIPLAAKAQPYTPIPLVTQGQIWTPSQWNSTWSTLNTLFTNPVLAGLGSGTVTATGATTPQSLSSITARVYAAEDFGAAGDGTTDDSVALNACVIAAAADHGICFLANKQYAIASSLNIPSYAALRGGTDPGQDGSNWNANVLRPMIIEGGSVTINVSGELSNVAVVRANINLNPTSAQNVISNVAAYNGTGVTLTGPAVVEHVVVIGMAQAITTNGQANFRLRHIRGDNTAGLLITQMHDFGWADDIEWMPMLNPSSGSAQVTAVVTGAANNGSGLVRLSVSSTSGFVTGNTLVVYGVNGTTGANGRYVINVINGTQIDLVGSTYAGTYTSGGTALLNATERSGAAYAVDHSESPLLTQIASYGYDTGLYLGASAGWVKVVGYNQDNYNAPDPGIKSIDVEVDSYGGSISVGYMGGWTPITMNTTADKPTVIEGGSIYGSNQAYPAQPAINLISGTLIMGNVDCRSMPFYVSSSATLYLSNSNCANSTWFSGYSPANIFMTNTPFGDVSGNSVRGQQIHMEVQNGSAWQDALDVTSSAVTANVPTTINAGTTSATNMLTVSGSDLAGDQGGQIKMTTTYPGATNPNKYLGITSGGDFYLNNSNFSGSLFRLTESGSVYFTGSNPVSIAAYGRNPSSAGSNWSVIADGAVSGGTNLAGGNLTLSGGISTGSGTSSVIFQAASAGSSGTSDNNPATVATISGASAAFNEPIQNNTYTVSTLPACGSGIKNSFAAVSDAQSTSSPLTGGGSLNIPVACNGSVWAPIESAQTFSVTDFGAKCDGNIVYGGVSVTSGSKTISTPTYAFTSKDVGAVINLSVAPFNSHSSSSLTSFTDTIASVSGGNAVLTDNATFTSTASGARWYHTVDTTAIQAALNAASSSPGGGWVQFPPGVCASGKLTLNSGDRLTGASQGGSVLMLANGTNTSLLVGNSFSSLTGNNGTGGVHDWAIQNLQLDGNRGANTGSGIGTAAAVGDAVQVYGYEFTMDNVLINNFAADGIYTEWSSSPGSPVDANGNYGPDGMEAHIHDVKCAYGAGWCWTFGGPHDSLVSHMTSLSMGTGGFLMLGTAAASPIRIDHFHGYQEPTDLNLQTNVTCDLCFAEGTSVLNGYQYVINDSIFGTLTLGVNSGPTVYNIYAQNTSVTTLNNVTGSGFQDVWSNSVIGTISGNAYTPSQSVTSRGLPTNLGSSFELVNGASYPVTLNQSGSSQFTFVNQNTTQWTNTGSSNVFNTGISGTAITGGSISGSTGASLTTQTYTSSTTWTPPSTATILRIVVKAQGGCGGGGAAIGASASGSGGGGGGGGGYKDTGWFPKSLVSGSGTITIGTACTAASAGATGGTGANASFAMSGMDTITSYGGGGGSGGASATASGGGGGAGFCGAGNNASGGSGGGPGCGFGSGGGSGSQGSANGAPGVGGGGSGTTSTGSASASPVVISGGAGGASGGGCSSGTPQAGGQGTSVGNNVQLSGGTAGGATGGVGPTGQVAIGWAGGGGSGGGGGTTTGGGGGAGGAGGGGGGGGGTGCGSSSVGGVGGVGGAAQVVVYSD